MQNSGKRRLVENVFSPEEKLFLQLSNNGYLNNIGWTKSFLKNESIDKDGRALPWVTYPFIDFLNGRLSKELILFEFGCGNSTFYYAERVNRVISVEHDRRWYEKIIENIQSNVEVIFEELEYDANYCRVATNTLIKFDIVIVDGRDRVNCVKQSMEALTERGMIVLDDLERPQYKEALDFLKSNGFKELGFWGNAPIINYKKCTSLFYKKTNAFHI